MALAQLSLQDVSINFGDVDILRKVNLDVQSGERIVLIGPSGYGKSVILKLFAGLLKPTHGRVLIDGQDLAKLSPSELAALQLKMGMLFQKNALFDSLTAGENVAFPLREKSGLPENEIQRKVEQFLKAVGLSHARDLYPDEISGGMQKRLGIARALALNPQIVLYDDPTAGLDPITSRMIAELIMEMWFDKSGTIVTVTNDMARAYQLADRIVMVVDGELIDTGDKEKTLANKDPRVAQFVRGQLEGPLTREAT